MNAQRLHAHALLENMKRTTPGGIRREQFVRRNWIKSLCASAPFVGLVAVFIAAIVTR